MSQLPDLGPLASLAATRHQTYAGLVTHATKLAALLEPGDTRVIGDRTYTVHSSPLRGNRHSFQNVLIGPRRLILSDTSGLGSERSYDDQWGPTYDVYDGAISPNQYRVADNAALDQYALDAAPLVTAFTTLRADVAQAMAPAKVRRPGLE